MVSGHVERKPMDERPRREERPRGDVPAPRRVERRSMDERPRREERPRVGAHHAASRGGLKRPRGAPRDSIPGAKKCEGLG